jgi:hypothetical protein
VGGSASNCTEDENIFLYTCGKIICNHRIFPKCCTNSKCSYSIIHLIWHPQDCKGAGLINNPFVVKQHRY